jgi:hypothetical protein
MLTSAILAGQSAPLDEGRLDPSWFGAGAVFQPSKELGLQWLKPGLDLRNRTIRLKAWEPAVWLLGQRVQKDQFFLSRLEGRLQPDLDQKLRRGLKGAVALSPTLGDVVLVGRVVDAVGGSEDYMSIGKCELSFDLKLVDGDTGELLGAFHDTLMGQNPEYVSLAFGRWSEALGRLLAASAAPPAVAKPAQAPAPPPFDLEGALRRIEGLRRDGLLNDEEVQALKKKASGKAARP